MMLVLAQYSGLSLTYLIAICTTQVVILRDGLLSVWMEGDKTHSMRGAVARGFEVGGRDESCTKPLTSLVGILSQIIPPTNFKSLIHLYIIIILPSSYLPLVFTRFSQSYTPPTISTKPTDSVLLKTTPPQERRPQKRPQNDATNSFNFVSSSNSLCI